MADISILMQSRSMFIVLFFLIFFFFQAEDGIRDLTVTGVQTCALPISVSPWQYCGGAAATKEYAGKSTWQGYLAVVYSPENRSEDSIASNVYWSTMSVEIGRASCRERV